MLLKCNICFCQHSWEIEVKLKMVDRRATASSIHSLSNTIYPPQGRGGLEPIPAVMGYTLHRSPVHYAERQTTLQTHIHTYSQFRATNLLTVHPCDTTTGNKQSVNWLTSRTVAGQSQLWGVRGRFVTSSLVFLSTSCPQRKCRWSNKPAVCRPLTLQSKIGRMSGEDRATLGTVTEVVLKKNKGCPKGDVNTVAVTVTTSESSREEDNWADHFKR